ncbi:hypothetical protein ACOLNO_003780 [Vibrio parahaemolyticus]
MKTINVKEVASLVKLSYQDSEINRMSKEFKTVAMIIAFTIPVMITIVYELNRLGESLWKYEKSVIDTSHLLTNQEFNQKYNKRAQ